MLIYLYLYNIIYLFIAEETEPFVVWIVGANTF